VYKKNACWTQEHVVWQNSKFNPLCDTVCLELFWKNIFPPALQLLFYAKEKDCIDAEGVGIICCRLF